jgi:ataxin-3
MFYFDNSSLGFIINRNEHWFALRKIRNHWWNLDSLLEKPEHISPFYLSAYAAQLRNEGSSVFLIRGELPACGEFHRDMDEANPQALLWSESQLLGKRNTNNSSNTTNQGQSGGGYSGNDDDDDLMLALALSESLQ